METQAWIVGTYTSRPAEDRAAFVLRLAGELQAWTDKNEMEACGYLATDGNGGWGVTLTTQKSQIFCMFAPDVLPPGMKGIGVTIHSHPLPTNGRMRVTPATIAALKGIGDKAKVKQIQDAHGLLRVEVETFSPDDYAAGPGYLVVGGTLLFQEGKGTARTLGTLDAAP